MGVFIDYYETLEIDVSATSQEIKEAYRLLSQLFHPDKINSDDPRIKEKAAEKFRKVHEAYQVLGNPKKRREYDTLLSSFNKGRKAGANDDYSSTPPTPHSQPSSSPSRLTKIFKKEKGGILVVAVLLCIFALAFLDSVATQRMRGGKALPQGSKVNDTYKTSREDTHPVHPVEKETLKEGESWFTLKVPVVRDVLIAPLPAEAASLGAKQNVEGDWLRDIGEDHEPIEDEENSPRLKRMVGVAYSYSMEQWAEVDASLLRDQGNGYYPKVGLMFWSGPVSGLAGIRWDGAYSVESNMFCVWVQNLKIGNSLTLPNFYTDIGVGYNVQLENALFSDGAMARTLILHRTFSGDIPSRHIKKCFGIEPVQRVERHRHRLSGEWEGSYETILGDGTPLEVNFIARLVGTGNKFEGVFIESHESDIGESELSKKRARVEGWLANGKVTFVKKYKENVIGHSYLASYSEVSPSLEGRWYDGLRQGKWKMVRKGDYVRSPDDIFGPDVTNPPEVPHG